MNDKKLAIVTPLLILAIMIGFTQIFIVPYWMTDHKFPPSTTGGSNAADLIVLGYNYNRDLATLSVTLWDKGTRAMNITGVSFDGASLAMGRVGSPTDLTSATGVVFANDIVFPAADQWNMNTGGPTSPVMEPSSIATLYLGVGQTSVGSPHTLTVSSGSVSYSFDVPS